MCVMHWESQSSCALINEISHTKRNRAYWTNIDVPEDWHDGLRRRDPDTCMDPGRTVQTYPAFGKDCVRPLGASWSDGPEGPVANTGRPLLVNDQTKDEAQHVQPHEAEKLMGMDAGTTAGPGITAKQRLQAIGGGWDINVTSVPLQHLKPRSVQAYTSRFWVENPAWKRRKNMSFFLAKPYGPGLKSRLR